MSKEEIKEKYGPKDMPKIKNPVSYGWHCFLKLFFYVYFGTGAIFLAIFVFPFIRLFSGKKREFGIVAREYVSHTFRGFLKALSVMGGTIVKNDNPEGFANMHGKIIIANHPSILDFVYIMSLVPNSTCIVKGSLANGPLGGVIRQAYITNSTDFNEVCEECKKLTDKGCNIIIFPEGTRTPRNCRNSYKKGAARLALYCNADVQPVFIGGSDKYGLGKHDKLWSFNPVEKYLYDFKLLPVISVEEYKKEESEPIAVKHLTEKMFEVITAAGTAYQENHPDCITLNNF